VADALPVLVAYIDVKEKYQFNNKAYSEWFGQPIEAIQGLSIRQLVGEERYQVAAPYIRRALQGERIQYDTTIMHIEKGKRYVSASYVPHIEEGKSLGFYSILVDITERVINEQALQTAFVEMEHKNQELSKINELLDNFVYMAAHDLKSPVANLKLLTGMLIRTDNSIHPELYAAIVESVNRLDNTINGLVEVIEIQSVQDIPVKTLDLKEQFAMLLHEHAEEIRGSGSVVDSDFSAHPSLKYVEAYLQSILKNLLTNAIKYRKNDIPLHLEVRSENAGGYVVVSFRDNGIGMNLKKYKQHLFKPFTRFTNRASGKGLGLHLIKSMVEKNGGKVQVESEPDKGTTFYVYLKEY
jgi:PAS domain S-box-containing protein